MNHKNMMLLGLLVCLSVGTLAQESPISPWQSLNSAMSDAPKDDAAAGKTGEEEFSDAPYDVTYPEADYQNETDYMSDEELILQSLPFKLPFKMDKKQLAVSMKILKAAVKPILKSKELRDAVAYIDESLAKYKTDLESQMYVTLLMDSMQEIYEGKETAELNMMIKRIFTDMSDEETARTLGSVWRSYVSPAIDNYVIDPMRSYVIQPVRSYLYEPISDYVYDFAERIETWMDGSQRPYIDIQYPENYYRRWSERVNDYASRISNWASQARQGLEMARRMLELQEEGRCHGCADQEEHYLEDVNFYNVQ
ncbi:uncharacterized protein [Macrobrachium rosenbergii]|uniref:uncharacterized protein n=1 Tax=Macrobrachium rosenbergii TaxID=79674 RepID=UPI0034D42490